MVGSSGAGWSSGAGYPPIAVSRANPHYLHFRGRPTILIASSEHYGAVINRDFDYVSYLGALSDTEQNYTRIYPGAFFEPEDYYVPGNTLGPPSDRVILPWARSDQPGHLIAGNRYDLDTWDPEYFARLRGFVAEASSREIVVEVCLFNAAYPQVWPHQAMHPDNNIQRVGVSDIVAVQTLRDPGLTRYQCEYVRAVVRALAEYDNVIYEIVDEPGLFGTPEQEYSAWISHLVDVIREEEAGLPHRHLIAQQVCGQVGGPADFSGDPRVDIATGQYAFWASGGQLGGLLLLDSIYHRDKPIELNETTYYPDHWELDPQPDGSPGTAVDAVAGVRVEAWEFIVGGGAAYNHLSHLYTAENPTAAGTGNEELLAGLRSLRLFMAGLDFTAMTKSYSLTVPRGVGVVRVLAEPGRQYAAYLHHSVLYGRVRYHVQRGAHQDKVTLVVPQGRYRAEWIDPASGAITRADAVDHPGGVCELESPGYAIDIALRLIRD